MRLRLTIVDGPNAGQAFELESDELVLVGRGQECDVQIADPRVSKEHCRILAQGGRLKIIDLNSRSGTYVNGNRVTECTFETDDEIVLGRTHLRVDVLADPGSTTIAPAEGMPSIGLVEQPDSGVAETAPYPAPAEERRKRMPKVDFLEELVGQRVLRYDVRKIVAKARTGIVFHAFDTKKECDVALKVLWPEFSQNEAAVRRFLRAIRTMMPIRHENLISLYGAGRSGGYCFTASEFVDGESAARTIQRVGVHGMLEWRLGLRIALHVARALQVAHERKIVHRNVTPKNILIRDEDGVVKLGDLMLAKALEGSQAEKLTRPGEMVGELPYMSPEQTAGNAHIDCRSDIYNLGATVYAVLTGRAPVQGDSLAETVRKIQNDPPEKPTKYHLAIAPLFEGVVLRMLAKSPDERYATPADLIRDLERVAQYEGVDGL